MQRPVARIAFDLIWRVRCLSGRIDGGIAVRPRAIAAWAIPGWRLTPASCSCTSARSQRPVV